MLFKPEDLMTESYDPIQEAADILNESVYLDESESLLSPVAIPVVENARIGANVVAFADVERLAEDHGVDYIDAMVGIAEANGIDMSHLAVSVPEWKIIANPEVVNELSNVVVAPISKNNPVYQFCEACVDMAIQEDEESYIDTILMGVITEEGYLETKKGEANSFSASTKQNSDAVISKYQSKIDALKAQYKKADQFEKAKLKTEIEKKMNALEKYKEQKNKQVKDAQKHEQRVADDHAANTSDEARKFYADQHKKELDAEKDAVKDDMLKARYGDGAAPVDAQTKSLLDRVKDAAKWPIQKISQAISSLKQKYQNLKTKIQSTAPEKRSIFQKFMNLIMSAIDKLSNLLSSKKAA